MPPPSTSPANLHALDYRAQARAMGKPCTPIIDIHLHLRGRDATTCFREAADCFGVESVVSMTPWQWVPDVQDVLGQRVRFTAVPDWGSDDPAHAHGEGFDQRIGDFASIGAPLCKFWAAPRARQYGIDLGDAAFLDLDGPVRRRQIELAASLGMGIMTHIADPDTWFATTYADSATWGTKLEQYAPLHTMVEAVDVPWLAAHMGGWPENLDALDALLDRHDNLWLDTSATKWMVRELSKHPSERLHRFLKQWQGRILFGSDIVVQQEHLQPNTTDTNASIKSTMSAKASSHAEAFDLYASRYFALRTLWETDTSMRSPIADPDLHMIDPSVDPMASPMLRGHETPAALLRSLYADGARSFLDQLRCATGAKASSMADAD
jgi:hypothetical protein